MNLRGRGATLTGCGVFQAQCVLKIPTSLIRRRFSGVPDLTADLYASLIEYLAQTGTLRRVPFDAAADPRAALTDISEDRVRQFLRTARQERQFVLAENSSVEKTLAHLNLLDHGRPSHAAILLFGSAPQRFLTTSEIKYLHFHGTEVRKPIPSYQIYKGTVFDLVDQAENFVLSKIARSVGTREHSTQAPVTYEYPELAVREAIVNAVAHRDYASNASVQVMIFADRLEVWNPGALPPSLTPEGLRRPHPSLPRNPLISEPLFLARYIEKAGTGTMDMIARCREAGLPEPEFRQEAGQVMVTLRRNWLATDMLNNFDLNQRQKKAATLVQEKGRIGNADYQRLTQSIKKTASRDLEDLVRKGVFVKFGTTGRGTYYGLAPQKDKGDIKGTKGTSPTPPPTEKKGAKKGTSKTRPGPKRKQ